MSLPVIDLSGGPREQGRRHGEALRERIVANLDLYFERFEKEGRLSPAEVLHRATCYSETLERTCPAYHEGLLGLAEGSGFDLTDLVALNVRYEILYHQFTVHYLEDAAGTEARLDGCTAFALAPSASECGRLLAGQNWDWIPGAQGAILRTTEDDGTRTLSFTEAGILGGKIGLNSHGLSLCINGMVSTSDDWSRLARPFHVRCYEILRARGIDEAVSRITGEERSCSTNFLIAAAPDTAVDIEAAPTVHRMWPLEQGWLVHANHFLAPEEIGVTEPPDPRRPRSCKRQARLSELLGADPRHSIADLKSHLRDHAGRPNSVCRHEDPAEPPEERYATLASVILDPGAGRMYVTEGPPCQTEYDEISLGTTAAS